MRASLGGVIYGPFVALSVTLMQAKSPPQHLAAMLAARSAVLLTASPLGTALGGPLTTALGPRATLGGSGLATVALGAVAAMSCCWPDGGAVRGRPRRRGDMRTQSVRNREPRSRVPLQDVVDVTHDASEVTMTGPPPRGIKTLLHPMVRPGQGAKRSRSAGPPAVRQDGSSIIRFRCAGKLTAGARRRDRRLLQILAGGLLGTVARHRGQAGRGDRRRRHQRGSPPATVGGAAAGGHLISDSDGNVLGVPVRDR